MVGWRNFDTSDGSTLPFSHETLDEMVNVPEYLTALIEQHSFVVFHETLRARCLLLACATQWGRETVFASHMKKPVVITHGLDYPAVESVLRLGGVKPAHRVALFRKLQLIEMGTIEGFAERSG